MHLCKLTPALVPENLFTTISLKLEDGNHSRRTYLKNIVGTSFHFLCVEPALLITPICTSSMISIAATGTPALRTLEAAAAASRIVGNVTTARLVSCGITANFNVISVTMPKVPSEPTKRPVWLYPAEDYLCSVRPIEVVQRTVYLPRPLPRLDHRTVSQNHCQVDDPFLHCAISDCICPAIKKLVKAISGLARVDYLQLVPTMPPILAYLINQRNADYQFRYLRAQIGSLKMRNLQTAPGRRERTGRSL